MHAWKILQEEIIDLEEFSAMVAIGGDGTLHEAINGMMFRKDGKRIPVAFIPNGTGNDTCNSIGIANIEQALSFILKGDTIKVDLNLCMMDAQTPQEIAEEERFDRLRYSIVNCGIGFIAKAVHGAAPYKDRFGGLSYLIAGMKEMWSGYLADTFSCSVQTSTVNEEPIFLEDQHCIICTV